MRIKLRQSATFISTRRILTIQVETSSTSLLHSPASGIGDIFFEAEAEAVCLRDLRRFLSFLAACSFACCATNSRISAPLSTTTCASHTMAAMDMDAAGERPFCGLCSGEQSSALSSKTLGNRSSSEMYDVAWAGSSSPVHELELSDERRGQDE